MQGKGFRGWKTEERKEKHRKGERGEKTIIKDNQHKYQSKKIIKYNQHNYQSKTLMTIKYLRSKHASKTQSKVNNHRKKIIKVINQRQKINKGLKIIKKII